MVKHGVGALSLNQGFEEVVDPVSLDEVAFLG